MCRNVPKRSAFCRRSGRDILQIVLAEGLLIARLRWGVTILFSVKMTAVIGMIGGQIGHLQSLDLVLSPTAMGLWLLLIMVWGTVASGYPAQRATALTVQDALINGGM
jgi:putative ABC transport system permease protein